MNDSTRQISSRAPVAHGSLLSVVGPGGYFTLGLGAMVGSGWVIVLGDWLRAAGPAGTTVGFLAGAAVMVLICLCYGELAARFSTAGAEFLYTLKTFGPRSGFLVAWFLTLFAVAVCSFEGIACAWLMRGLMPHIALSTAYTIAGTSVSWDALLIGVLGSLAIGALHFRGTGSAIAFQNLATFGFLGISILLIVAGWTLGTPGNLQPLWGSSDGSWVKGAFWVYATCAFFLNSWQTALHAIEERRSHITSKIVIKSMIASILVGALFYIGVVLAAAAAVHWPSLLGAELPAAAAFRALGFGGLLGTVVLVAAIISLLKTWSAMTWIGSRLLFAQARHGLVPSWLGVVHRSGAPRNAVCVVTALSILGLALGRGAIIPIVNMVSICQALSLVFCLLVLIRLRQADTPKPSYTVTGGAATITAALVGALAMIAGALVEPFIQAHGHIPIEWALLGSWAMLGFAVWTLSARHSVHRRSLT